MAGHGDKPAMENTIPVSIEEYRTFDESAAGGNSAKGRNTMLNVEPNTTSDILSENGSHHTSIVPALLQAIIRRRIAR